MESQKEQQVWLNFVKSIDWIIVLSGFRKEGDRLISLALPRIRDFRGVSPNSFDGRGNYSLGIREQLIFPEIDYDSIEQIRGMDIAIITTAKNDEEGRALLKEMGMPFRDKWRGEVGEWATISPYSLQSKI